MDPFRRYSRSKSQENQYDLILLQRKGQWRFSPKVVTVRVGVVLQQYFGAIIVVVPDCSYERLLSSATDESPVVQQVLCHCCMAVFTRDIQRSMAPNVRLVDVNETLLEQSDNAANVTRATVLKQFLMSLPIHSLRLQIPQRKLLVKY